jgi:homoserine dehydrogenase
MSKNLKIGLFGFGCVGQGFYHILEKNTSLNATIKSISIKNINKSRNIDAQYFTNKSSDILDDKEIDLIVETIDDADAAYSIVKRSLKNGIPVISANKKMIASQLAELLSLQKESQTTFLYDAAVCGSIPIIRNIEDYYQNDNINEIETICNGTTNYILTKTTQENKSYSEVLKEAQALGFAETDPTLDVQAFDSKYKLIILTAHAFGLVLSPDSVWNYGIQFLEQQDIRFAQTHGFSIKLIAKAQKTPEGLKVYVAPHFIADNHPFFHVHNENNAVAIRSEYVSEQVLYGKGAGSLPTGASVFSDVYALKKAYKYDYLGFESPENLEYNPNIKLKVYCRFETQSLIEEIDFTNIEELTNHYIIGNVRLQTLIEAKLNERKGVFLVIF